MGDAKDLSDATRAWLDELHGKIAGLSHYQLLAVPPDADKKDIKAAYFKLVNLVHTDRWAGKDLGRYRGVMETIFIRATEAYETLSNDEKRAAYGTGNQAAERKAALDAQAVARREAAGQALKARFEAGRGKVKELIDRATKAGAAGDMMTAAECYRQALGLTPNDPALKVAYERFKQLAEGKIEEAHRSKAVLEERFGKWAEAAASWQRVVEANPRDAEARARLAEALSRAGRR